MVGSDRAEIIAQVRNMGYDVDNNNVPAPETNAYSFYNYHPHPYIC